MTKWIKFVSTHPVGSKVASGVALGALSFMIASAMFIADNWLRTKIDNHPTINILMQTTDSIKNNQNIINENLQKLNDKMDDMQKNQLYWGNRFERLADEVERNDRQKLNISQYNVDKQEDLAQQHEEFEVINKRVDSIIQLCRQS